MRFVPRYVRGVVYLIAASALIVGSARAASAAPTFVYALRDVGGAPNQIYGFSLNPVTGALTLLPGFPVATGSNGDLGYASERVKYHNGRLFVLNAGSATLSVFAVDGTTGALIAAPFSPLAVPAGVGVPYCVGVHPSGSPVVVGGNGAAVASFALTGATATAAPGSPYAAATSWSCQFSADGNYAYVGGLATQLNGFAVNAGTGQLTPLAGSPFDMGASNPVGYATDASGRLFLSHFGGAQIKAFTTAGGIPAAVAGSPFVSGLSNPVDGVLHPAGFYLAVDRTGNRVGVYRIGGSGAATTVTAVAGSPFATGGLLPSAVTLTPAGGFLIAANADSRNLSVFGVNAATGALTAAPLQPANTLGATGTVASVAVASDGDVPVAGSYDSDARADTAVFRPSTGIWYERLSTTLGTVFEQWGMNGDVPVRGDFDGDGKTDVAVFRPSTGIWYIRNSSTLSTAFQQWGVNGDIPVPDDYDGDGKTDVAVWRPSTGIWYIRNSGAPTSPSFLQWGVVGDVPVVGDYDGDGQADATVFRPSTGIWYVRNLVTNTPSFYQWGVNGDIPVQGDFDGDGKADVAVWRPSTGIWYINNSSAPGSPSFQQWGVAGDVPVPSDFDGDGKTDVAVYRISTGIWYVRQSSNATGAFLQWGLAEP